MLFKRVTGAFLAALSFHVAAADFDVSLDFSTTTNPNGPWSYGQEAGLNPATFSVLPNVHSDSQAGPNVIFWNNTNTASCYGADTVPFVAKNTANLVSTFLSAQFPKNQVALHPASGNGYSVIRWTANEAGDYALAAIFTGLDDAETTTDVHVLRNGTSLFSDSISGFYLGGYGSRPITSTGVLTATFAVGDYVDFAVGSNGIQHNDTTGLSAQITALFRPGSVNLNLAQPNEVAFVLCDRTPPQDASPIQIDLKGLDILTGSSYTLGVNETLNLDNGQGLLNVKKGAVFTGNGIINGSVINSGLVRIPIVALPKVSGGHIQIAAEPSAPAVTPDPVVFTGGAIVGVGAGGAGGFGGGAGGGGGTPAPKVVMIDAPAITNQDSTFAVDASLEVTGTYTQTETGSLRLFVGGDDAASFGDSKSGGTYSQLFVGKAVTLDGSLQVVLQPELFAGFDYVPQVGDTFDFVISKESITLLPTLTFETFVTAAGAGRLSDLTLTAFNSGISSDPDTLFSIAEHLFDFSLVENGTILRGTLVAPLHVNPAPVPVPAAIWLLGSAMMSLGARRRRRA